MKSEELLETIKEIAQRIKNMRELLGITQKVMAEAVGVSLGSYIDYESGLKDFDFTFIYKCAKYFGVDPTDLLSGSSPTLSGYEITRKDQGLSITRLKGYQYLNKASYFKNKTTEPFWVKMPYSLEEEEHPKFSSHAGQEFDIVIKGHLKAIIGSNIEYLNEGDTIYYNSGVPHALVPLDGEDVEIYAMVMNADNDTEFMDVSSDIKPDIYTENHEDAVYKKFITITEDKGNRLVDIKFKNENSFNFAFDCVDELAKREPNKTAMVYVANDKKSRKFTFGEMSMYSSKTANYFLSLGIKKGDRVMLVLKRHYQFWFSILALHKIGAIVIPATNLLVEHDFDYRFKAADVKAIVCTNDGDVSNQVDLAAMRYNLEKILVGGSKEGWHDFNSEMEKCSDYFPRPLKGPCGKDPMLMFFTSGTTGYPKLATHNYKYPLGHFVTAKYWHNVNPNGIHFTIADTGWGKALWGKLYGQWLCECAIFVYDFDRFKAEDILPMFKKYNITTFCAPPTMYRFFIKEDLSKYDLSSLEYSTVAGEALNPEVYEQWRRATGLRLMEGFGQTETTLTVANLRGMVSKPGSMGRPNPEYDVDIVDENSISTKVGSVGEIVIRANKNDVCGLFVEYYNNPDETKSVWHDGLYHTGDLAWKDEDGYFWYVGRSDDVIKSSGYRIGPFEIESVIMELPYVLECVVTPVPDPIRGQIVKATIVLAKNIIPSEEMKKEIQTYVKSHTAPYKYPRVVDFVTELPKTISGKIRRVEIRERDNN